MKATHRTPKKENLGAGGRGPSRQRAHAFMATKSKRDWAAEALDLREYIAELEAALRPFATYASKRNEVPMLGLGDTVHCIHGGTEHETEIKLSHCQEALRLLQAATP